MVTGDDLFEIIRVFLWPASFVTREIVGISVDLLNQLVSI